MGRKKAAAPAVSTDANKDDDQMAVNEQEVRRSTRKRAVNPNTPVQVEPDEPIVKKGRRAAKTAASKKTDIAQVQVNGNDDSSEAIKQGITKKAQILITKVVVDDDTKTVKKAVTKRGRAKKEDTDQVQVKEEDDNDDDDSTVQVKEENDEDDSTVPTKKTSAKKAAPKKQTKVKKEKDDDSGASTSQKASSGKGKQKSKNATANEEASPAAKPPGGEDSDKKGKKKKGSGKENSDSSNIPREKPVKSGVERVVVVKGRAAVDALCPISKTSHVLEEGDDIWDCMLNQTNIQFNNNKYYLIQLLKDDEKNVYSVWMRWGRVGANGQNSLQPCGDNLQKAKNIFTKKFSDKTKNDWDMRDCFEKVPGKYDLLAMDYSKEDTTDSAVKDLEKIKQERTKIESKLEIRVRALIEFICDVRIMEEAVVEMKYDAKKAPLGKLTTDQIKAGYAALKRIDDIVLKGKYSNMELVHACNDFYTRIPHYFGMKVPPLIKTKVEIKEKVALLEALGDIQAALSIMDQPIDVTIHPVDQHYRGLQCEISPLEKKSQDYKVLEKYLQSTHAKTHTAYKMELLEVFVCKKDLEYERFKDVGNRMLLWHGSRLSNWAGILSQGLRIAPPEAPSTGYMFGKGIYFADMSSKSANYCWATPRSDVGFLALSEVALGKCNELLNADYNANKLPKGYNSVKGCGQMAPQAKNYSKLSDGIVVPLGPGEKTGAENSKGYTLLYNEYIVYDPAQVRTRFLLKIKFSFR